MLRGFATVNFFADDLIAARDWYADLLGIDAYFQRPDAQNPAYIEFRVGDYQDELGIIDRKYAPHRDEAPGGAVRRTGTSTTWRRREATCWPWAPRSTSRSPERERGFVTASVVDPFGNILGVMYNPHYVEVLAAR